MIIEKGGRCIKTYVGIKKIIGTDNELAYRTAIQDFSCIDKDVEDLKITTAQKDRLSFECLFRIKLKRKY